MGKNMKMPVVSGREFLKILSKHYGFRVIRQKGSHLTITNDISFVTIPMHDELDIGTLKSVLDDIGISREEFLKIYRK